MDYDPSSPLEEFSVRWEGQPSSPPSDPALDPANYEKMLEEFSRLQREEARSKKHHRRHALSVMEADFKHKTHKKKKRSTTHTTHHTPASSHPAPTPQIPSPVHIPPDVDWGNASSGDDEDENEDEIVMAEVSKPRVEHVHAPSSSESGVKTSFALNVSIYRNLIEFLRMCGLSVADDLRGKLATTLAAMHKDKLACGNGETPDQGGSRIRNHMATIKECIPNSGCVSVVPYAGAALADSVPSGALAVFCVDERWVPAVFVVTDTLFSAGVFHPLCKNRFWIKDLNASPRPVREGNSSVLTEKHSGVAAVTSACDLVALKEYLSAFLGNLPLHLITLPEVGVSVAPKKQSARSHRRAAEAQTKPAANSAPDSLAPPEFWENKDRAFRSRLMHFIRAVCVYSSLVFGSPLNPRLIHEHVSSRVHVMPDASVTGARWFVETVTSAVAAMYPSLFGGAKPTPVSARDAATSDMANLPLLETQDSRASRPRVIFVLPLKEPTRLDTSETQSSNVMVAVTSDMLVTSGDDVTLGRGQLWTLLPAAPSKLNRVAKLLRGFRPLKFLNVLKTTWLSAHIPVRTTPEEVLNSFVFCALETCKLAPAHNVRSLFRLVVETVHALTAFRVALSRKYLLDMAASKARTADTPGPPSVTASTEFDPRSKEYTARVGNKAFAVVSAQVWRYFTALFSYSVRNNPSTPPEFVLFRPILEGMDTRFAHRTTLCLEDEEDTLRVVFSLWKKSGHSMVFPVVRGPKFAQLLTETAAVVKVVEPVSRAELLLEKDKQGKWSIEPNDTPAKHAARHILPLLDLCAAVAVTERQKNKNSLEKSGAVEESLTQEKKSKPEPLSLGSCVPIGATYAEGKFQSFTHLKDYTSHLSIRNLPKAKVVSQALDNPLCDAYNQALEQTEAGLSNSNIAEASKTAQQSWHAELQKHLLSFFQVYFQRCGHLVVPALKAFVNTAMFACIFAPGSARSVWPHAFSKNFLAAVKSQNEFTPIFLKNGTGFTSKTPQTLTREDVVNTFEYPDNANLAQAYAQGKAILFEKLKVEVTEIVDTIQNTIQSAFQSQVQIWGLFVQAVNDTYASFLSDLNQILSDVTTGMWFGEELFWTPEFILEYTAPPSTVSTPECNFPLPQNIKEVYTGVILRAHKAFHNIKETYRVLDLAEKFLNDINKFFSNGGVYAQRLINSGQIGTVDNIFKPIAGAVDAVKTAMVNVQQLWGAGHPLRAAAVVNAQKATTRQLRDALIPSAEKQLRDIVTFIQAIPTSQEEIQAYSALTNPHMSPPTTTDETMQEEPTEPVAMEVVDISTLPAVDPNVLSKIKTAFMPDHVPSSSTTPTHTEPTQPQPPTHAQAQAQAPPPEPTQSSPLAPTDSVGTETAQIAAFQVQRERWEAELSSSERLFQTEEKFKIERYLISVLKTAMKVHIARVAQEQNQLAMKPRLEGVFDAAHALLMLFSAPSIVRITMTSGGGFGTIFVDPSDFNIEKYTQQTTQETQAVTTSAINQSTTAINAYTYLYSCLGSTKPPQDRYLYPTELLYFRLEDKFITNADSHKLYSSATSFSSTMESLEDTTRDMMEQLLTHLKNQGYTNLRSFSEHLSMLTERIIEINDEQNEQRLQEFFKSAVIIHVLYAVMDPLFEGNTTRATSAFHARIDDLRERMRRRFSEEQNLLGFGSSVKRALYTELPGFATEPAQEEHPREASGRRKVPQPSTQTFTDQLKPPEKIDTNTEREQTRAAKNSARERAAAEKREQERIEQEEKDKERREKLEEKLRRKKEAVERKLQQEREEEEARKRNEEEIQRLKDADRKAKEDRASREAELAAAKAAKQAAEEKKAQVAEEVARKEAKHAKDLEDTFERWKKSVWWNEKK